VPSTISALSWNVESLGDTKAVQPGTNPQTESELITFLNLVIRGAAADLVGITELKAGQGETVCRWLLAKLNNVMPAPAYTWKGVVSSRQDGGTQEEYVLLWQDQVNRLTLDPEGQPAPASLIGVLDDRALSRLFKAKAWTPTQQADFFAALQSAGYAEPGRYKSKNRFLQTRWPRVKPAGWDALNGMARPQATIATPPTTLSVAELQQIAQTILDVDVLRFITFGDRAPYLVNLRVGNQSRPLAAMLFHASGPQDPTRTDAINIIGLSRPAVQAARTGNLLLMGDFNIAAAQATLTGRVYSRHTNAQGAFVFAQVQPIQTDLIFAPITGRPLNATDLLGAAPTTLIKAYIADVSPPASALANPFDKLFFRGNNLTASGAAVLNLLDVLNPASPQHSAGVSRSALTFFRSLRGAAFLVKADHALARSEAKLARTILLQDRQLINILARISSAPRQVDKHSPLRKRRGTLEYDRRQTGDKQAAVQAQRAALAVALALVNNNAAVTPTGVGTALTVYRHAVSDHLPITVKLTG
jgi:endonuclease/exonuclease/phosphatase family metal-dependent hydrolase